jgi:type VI secretion system secreted protein VgrG
LEHSVFVGSYEEIAMKDLLTISSSALGAEPQMVAFRAREALGSPYEIELFLTVPLAQEVDVSEAVGQRATLAYDPRGDTGLLRWSGVLVEVSILLEIGDRSLVRAVLVPRLHRLAHAFHTRVFTGKSITTITKELLEGNGLRHWTDFDEAGLSQSYPAEEHVGQWQETDLDFLHRWFEREGVFYWFEQGDDAEKLVLTDTNPSGASIAARYRPESHPDFSRGPSLSSFRCDGRALPGSVRVADRDYCAPALDLSKEGELSDFPSKVVLPHARLMRPADVDRISKARSETMRATAKTYRAEGTVIGLQPGVNFKLEEHPRAAFNVDYLVVATDHIAWAVMPSREMREAISLEAPNNRGDRYVVRLSAIERTTPFRLQKRTAWPRIDGYETADVDGPLDSDYAQLDEHGRYLIRFHADESLGEDGKVSTWVRMMQPHAGSPEGVHFPLRKGTEVLVAFLCGDPDRPVILGAVPNAVTPSVVTESNHTQNRLFTGGGTTLEIEDLAGEQYVHGYTPVDRTNFHLGAPRKMQAEAAPTHTTEASLGWSTDGACVLSVGGECDVGIGGKLHEIVNGEVVEEYRTKRTETVNGDVIETYDGNHELHVKTKQTYTIDGGKLDMIKSGWEQNVSDSWMQYISGGWYHVADGGWHQTINGGWNQVITGGWNQTLTGDWTQTVIGNWNQLVAGNVTITAKKISLIDNDWYELNNYKIIISGAKVDISGISTTNVGIKIDSAGMKIDVTGVKVDLVPILNFGLSGMKFDYAGFKDSRELLTTKKIAAAYEEFKILVKLAQIILFP